MVFGLAGLEPPEKEVLLGVDVPRALLDDVDLDLGRLLRGVVPALQVDDRVVVVARKHLYFVPVLYFLDFFEVRLGDFFYFGVPVVQLLNLFLQIRFLYFLHF